MGKVLDPPALKFDPDSGTAWVTLRKLQSDADHEDTVTGFTYDIDNAADTLIDYSYSGEAFSLEILNFPAHLDQTPLPHEVHRVLQSSGLRVRRPARISPRPPCATDWTGSPVLTFDSKGTVASVRFRPGHAYYVHDLIGDGSNYVEFSYTGQALRYVLDQSSGPGYVDYVPYRKELTALLRDAGVPTVDPDDPEPRRPRLSDRASMGIDYTSAELPDRHRYRLEYPDEAAQSTRVRYTRSGYPCQLEFSSFRSGVQLKGEPERDRVEAIPRHQGVRILD